MATPHCEACALFAHVAPSVMQLLGRWLCRGHVDLAQKISRENPARQLVRYYMHRNGGALALPLERE